MSTTPITEVIPIYTDADNRLRVTGTRVLLDLIVYAWQQGETPEQIVQMYPSLSLEQVYLAIGYYLRHQSEVDAYIAAVDAEAEQIREKIMVQSPPAVSYETLLRRLQAKRDNSE